MLPVGLDGKPWTTDQAMAKINQIKAEVVAELNAADIARGLPENLQTYRKVAKTGSMAKGGEPAYDLVPDPMLSRLKHSGADTQYELLVRWQEFCDTPQDPAQVKPNRVVIKRKEPSPEERLGGYRPPQVPEQELEATVKQRASLAEKETPKRKAKGGRTTAPRGVPPID